jgi:hypothetical protein
MPDVVPDEEAKMQELNDKRKPLFEEFRRHPQRLHLAVELKTIDDKIAEIAATRKKRKSR